MSHSDPRAHEGNHPNLASRTQSSSLTTKNRSTNYCLIVAFRSAKGRSFAERKTTLIDRSVLNSSSDKQFWQHTRCVTERIDVDTGPLQQAPPQITEQSLAVAHDHVATVFDASSAAGDECWTIRQRVHRTEICSQRDRAVVEQA